MSRRRPARQYTPKNVGPKPVYLTKGIVRTVQPQTSTIEQLPKLQKARVYNPPKLSKPSAAVINLPKSVSVVKNGSPVKVLQSLPTNPVRTMVKYNKNRALAKTNNVSSLIRQNNNKSIVSRNSPKPTTSKTKTVHLHPPIKKKTISKPNRNTIIQRSTLITTTMKK